jgi:hypothetical protein
LKVLVDRIARCFRKACNLPPHHDCSRQVVVSRVFLSSAAAERKIVQPLRRLVQPVCTNPPAFSFARTVAGRLRLFLFFDTDETRRPRLRNFDTTLPSSYRYEFRSDNRLESVANAHTAADLHVRPVSKTALVSRSWAPRTKLKLHDAWRLAMHLIQHRRA